MGANNKDSKESVYGSKLEQYLDEQGEDEFDSNFDDESNMNSPKIGTSRLDDYIGIDDEEEEEEINHCSICGKKLKKFNYGDKCDDCVKKCELVNDINKLLDYVSPSEELDKDILLDAGFDELELNITISNLLDENLIILGSKGIYLTNVKTLNNFFEIYGSATDILDESLYKKSPKPSKDFVDLSYYPDLVQILFNSKIRKWAVSLFRDGKFIVKKHFVSILEANAYAAQYLREMGELDNPRHERPVMQKVKYKTSKHKFVFFSMKRNQWGVRVKGHVGFKLVGFFDTEEEAVIARDNYIQKKRENQAKLRPKRFVKDESDAIISFHDRSNQWVVKVKNKRGGFKKLGYFDTEEEAIAAKNEYYGISNELESDSASKFSEGDRVQVTSGSFEFNFGIIKEIVEEKDSCIVKLENDEVPFPMLIKSDLLRLI